MSDLYDFVRESNKIEGIDRWPLDKEIKAHEDFLTLPAIRVADLENFVKVVAGAPLRRQEGMNVRVGRHFPEPGGRGIELGLEEVLRRAVHDPSPWAVHVAYEKLHPFMDGNGRSGRALWAWMRFREGQVLALVALVRVQPPGLFYERSVRDLRPDRLRRPLRAAGGGRPHSVQGVCGDRLRSPGQPAPSLLGSGSPSPARRQGDHRQRKARHLRRLLEGE